MPSTGKDGSSKDGGVGPREGMADDNETLGEALSRAGFEPAKVGRRIVPQGRRREALKKRDTTNADK